MNLPPGFTLTWFESIGSTNDEALARAAEGAAEGTVIWAGEQTAGRGRRGRVWSSPRGNCYSSVVLRPLVPPAEAARLSFVATLAVLEAARALLPAAKRVSCKWPNDVLVDGAKVAGILLESRIAASGLVDPLVIGTGINLVSFPADTPYGATSLHQAGATAATETVLEAYLDRLAAWYRRWRAEGFQPVRQAWLAAADGVGAEVVVRLPDGELTGIFESLDEGGALLLRCRDGQLRTIAAGDVHRAA